MTISPTSMRQATVSSEEIPLVCYFDCTNYYFEIETADDDYVDEVTGEVSSSLRKYGISKQHQPSPIVQMGLFIDAQGIPLSMCINPGNQNEQLCATSTEKKMIRVSLETKGLYTVPMPVLDRWTLEDSTPLEAEPSSSPSP